MALRHGLLALLCVLVWGGSFAVIRWGLHDLPPLAFASLRFSAVALLILFVGRPAIGWRMLLLYGCGWGVVQFAGLFLALHFGLPTSLSSVLAQLQVFFTLLFSVALGWESLSRRKLFALALAVIGVGLIVSDRSADLPAAALGFSLLGAAGWASGNLVARRLAVDGLRADTLAFVAWASLPPALILGGLSAVLESPQHMLDLSAEAVGRALAAVLYQALGALLIGTLCWNRLLRHYPATLVAPFSLLVPVIGLLLGVLLFDEKLSAAAVGGCLSLLLALCGNLGWARRARI